MAQTMVERVARALAASHYEDKDPNVMWRDMIPDARAAIEAMREPTEGMVRRGDYAHVDPSETYQSMIDAALSETSQ